MRALQRHRYREALTHFDDLVQRFPTERALVDRARVYATLCERELHRETARVPTTPEEYLTAATAALNNDDDLRAEHFVTLALNKAPNHELAYYLLAVVHARRGSTKAALDALRRSIAISPDVRAQALHDADFQPLRHDDAFQQMLVGPTTHSGTRRGPQHRSE